VIHVSPLCSTQPTHPPVSRPLQSRTPLEILSDSTRELVVEPSRLYRSLAAVQQYRNPVDKTPLWRVSRRVSRGVACHALLTFWLNFLFRSLM
jgi:hypothetical protein